MKDTVLTPESIIRASPDFRVKYILGGGKMVHSYSQKLLLNHYFNVLNRIIELFSFKSFIQKKKVDSIPSNCTELHQESEDLANSGNF